MREQEEERSFTVSDRRGRAAESPPEPPPVSRPSTPTQTSDPGPESSGPLDFSSFLFSLASTAVLHLGDPMPDGRTAPVNLPRAQEMIDLLALLETKTQGNLTPDESALLANLLYTLRLRYVEKAR
ncbi:MAG: DUF1844 domain-containing protein [Nitrospiria bacterium]